MNQPSLGLNLSTKRTHKREFLVGIDRIVPWVQMVAVNEPHYPKGKTGWPPMGVATMLRVHGMQQWFGLSDPAMEETLHVVPLCRKFAGLEGAMRRLPDASTILWFRYLLEKNELVNPMLATVNAVSQGHALLHGKEIDVFGDAGYQGLAKNTAKLTTLFALSNLWMARRNLIGRTP